MKADNRKPVGFHGFSVTRRCFKNLSLDTYPVLRPLSSSECLVHADILLSFQFLRGR